MSATRRILQTLRRLVVTRSFSARELGAHTVETAIVFPVVLAITFGAVQVAMWYQARSMCQAAAQAGVRASRALDAPAGAGTAAATAYLQSTAGDLLTSRTVTETVTAEQVRVSCRGTAQRVMPVPGLSISVEQSAAAARERFTTPSGEFTNSEGSGGGN